MVRHALQHERPQSRRAGRVGRQRRGFTVAEAAMASAVLGLIMLAVATAVASAQQMAFESQKRLLASLAADDLLSEISTLPYDDLSALHNRTDEIGSMRTLDGDAYPGSFWALGRRVSVTETTMEDIDLGISVPGRLVSVWCFDAFADLAHYQVFVPEGGG